MATNPNPGRITAPMWRLWESFNAAYPPVLLGGIYARKPGYHGTRAENSASNYSVRDAIDREGPGDKAAAIDLTFPDAQRGDFRTIARFSKRLLDAGRRRDPRLYQGGEAVIREFYGNADLDREVEGWDFRYNRAVSSDTSHLWHIHISVTRKYVDDWNPLAGVLEVLTGQEEDEMIDRDDVERIWRTDGIVEKPTGYPDSDNKYWMPASVIRSAQYWSRRAGKRLDEYADEILAGQAAILARLDGKDDGATRAAIRDELTTHRAALVAVLGEDLAAAVADELVDLPAERVEAAVGRALARTRLAVADDEDDA